MYVIVYKSLLLSLPLTISNMASCWHTIKPHCSYFKLVHIDFPTYYYTGQVRIH